MINKVMTVFKTVALDHSATHSPGLRGFEPPAAYVTGKHSNQAELQPHELM